MQLINTYKRFFRYLRKAREEHGVSFVLLRSNLKVKDDDGRPINAHSIWARHYFSGGMTGYLSPFQVLHRTFFQDEGVKEWVGSYTAAMAIGLPEDKYQELCGAQLEGRKHLLSLRRRMLKACDLNDNKKRPRYQHCTDIVPVGDEDVPF